MPKTQIPSSEESIIKSENKTLNTTWFSYFQGVYLAIRANFSVRLQGVLFSSAEPVSNSATLESDLISYSLRKNSLRNKNDIVKIQAFGSYAATTNNKVLKLYFGSDEIFNSGSVALNDVDWSIKATILKISDSEQIVEVVYTSGSNINTEILSTSQNLITADSVIKCTGAGDAKGDVTQKGMIVEFTPFD